MCICRGRDEERILRGRKGGGEREGEVERGEREREKGGGREKERL